ncbi:prolyl oligopeptidase family serine peptidase [Mucilaginibacter sp. CSA2-8R]|uniref:S9 family peptidase n=1 Tax=Mucilaginibacter sp. CSA2-8R TaxID=3141542 RepID=UPI00315CD1C3
MESITSYPFSSELTSGAGNKIALAINIKGKRNIYVANGPEYALHQLTAYHEDDGLELTSVSISPDGTKVVFVRGGDHGAYDESTPRNPSSAPVPPKVQVISIPFNGGEPVVLGEGDYPVISPKSDRVAFIKNAQIWVAPVNGLKPAKPLFYAKGGSQDIQWSPDGDQLMFVSSRTDHALIGIFTDSISPIKWIAPAFANDQSPRWSLDGKSIAFVRRPATGGAPDSLTARKIEPWAIWTADAASGAAKQLWKSPETLAGSVPGTHGGFNLRWAANSYITFVSYQDGWPHLYSIPGSGMASELLLTPGKFAVEHITLSPDHRWLYFSANTGPDQSDLDRRHIARVPVDKPAMEMLTDGKGIESYPIPLADGKSTVLISATAQRPGLPAVLPGKGHQLKLMGETLMPAELPLANLITPRSVKFTAADGKPVYGQLFEPAGGQANRPAILFVHGGPKRQMLLGWHYADYYANTYALNQYLASKGYVVLAVNYRLGTAYGYEFQNPKNAGFFGASEYQDIKAAGEWLAANPKVDAKKIGIYGGSYGGFMTALAMARDAKLFAAGVDIHGLHNLTGFLPEASPEKAPDLALATAQNWKSSPVSNLDNWTSPVLIIHGDDDGNVKFHQSIDLIRRLEQKKIPFESMLIPDETHHWMRYRNMLKVDEAVADFFNRKLLAK